ncbi:MAG: hypothetical protein K8I02_07730, partial [Candidatus Methylomirabilis sp.]|nr:hypothetical protein [Deltaproteobacteria bacterium]
MLILGITHPGAMNNAAAILRDGELLAFAEEERFNRVKHSSGVAPNQAIAYCLKAAGAELGDLDRVAVGWDYAVEWSPALVLDKRARGHYELQHHFFRQLRLGPAERKIRYVNHHVAHAASAYLFSGFEKCAVMTIDGSGGQDSGLLGVAEGTELKVLHKIPLRGSWGNLYSAITSRLGFQWHSAEGKVMGLAAFGKPDPERFKFVNWDAEIPEVDWEGFRKARKELPQFTNTRSPSQEQKDLAATIQWTLEQAGLRMSQWLHGKTGLKAFALAGGCALNCSMNGFLLRQSHVDDIFIQPAAHDAGTALGAAAWVHARETGKRPRTVFNHAYWGPSFENAEIEAALRRFKITSWKRCDAIAEEAAELLARGELLGWFQGRMEVGPRALGGRSMLANPGKPEMKDKMNAEVKNREGWRPFAPSFLPELAKDYVTVDYPSPFMILAFQGREEKIEEIPAATHVDKTVRVQTVNPATNPVYHALIAEFRKRTGLPAVLN